MAPAKKPSDQKHTKKKSKRARLGRGLGALIDQAPSSIIAVEITNAEHQETKQNSYIDSVSDETLRVLDIPLGQIVPNPHQPRRAFDEQALSTLAESIAMHGLMQPIVVRRVGGHSGSAGYELVAGERRWRATKLAGLASIRAVLSEADDERSAELALIENIQRADLNPIERASGFAQLIERFGLTQQALADRMGMSRPAVANQLRLLELDEELREYIAQGALGSGHGKVLLSCEDLELRRSLATLCVSEKWTVRLLESKLVAATKAYSGQAVQQDEGQPDRVSSVLLDLEQRMSEQLGTRVTLSTNKDGSKGRVVIEFYGLDQFDGLLERLGVAGEADVV